MSCLLPIHTDDSYFIQAHPFINQKYKKRKKIFSFGVK